MELVEPVASALGKQAAWAASVTGTMLCWHAALLEGCCLLLVTGGGWCTTDTPISQPPVPDLWSSGFEIATAFSRSRKREDPFNTHASTPGPTHPGCRCRSRALQTAAAGQPRTAGSAVQTNWGRSAPPRPRGCCTWPRSSHPAHRTCQAQHASMVCCRLQGRAALCWTLGCSPKQRAPKQIVKALTCR